MNTPQEVIRFYIDRIENAPHLVERELIISDLQLYYYRLSESESKTVASLMQPFLGELEQEMIQKDGLLKQAHDTLNRIASSQLIEANDTH